MDITILAYIVKETEAAMLVRQHGKEIWIPRSQISYVRKRVGIGDSVMSIPEWLARKKGLDYEATP